MTFNGGERWFICYNVNGQDKKNMPIRYKVTLGMTVTLLHVIGMFHKPVPFIACNRAVTDTLTLNSFLPPWLKNIAERIEMLATSRCHSIKRIISKWQVKRRHKKLNFFSTDKIIGTLRGRNGQKCRLKLPALARNALNLNNCSLKRTRTGLSAKAK